MLEYSLAEAFAVSCCTKHFKC